MEGLVMALRLGPVPKWLRTKLPHPRTRSGSDPLHLRPSPDCDTTAFTSRDAQPTTSPAAALAAEPHPINERILNPLGPFRGFPPRISQLPTTGPIAFPLPAPPTADPYRPALPAPPAL